MVAPIGVGDIMAARAWTQLDEQGAVNTFNFLCVSNTGASATDQEFASFMDLDEGLSTFYKALCPPTVEYRGVQAYFMKSSGSLPGPVQSTAGAGVGTHGTTPTPRNTCPILKYKTSVRGPGGRGRVYLPFVSSLYVADNGRPTVALDVLVNGLCAVLLTPITVGTAPNQCSMVWVLLKKAIPPAEPSGSVIIDARNADKFGQLHKRGDYGRANESPI